MNVFFFGAGSSRGTLGEKAPVASEFGCALNRRVPTWKDDFPSLAEVVQHLKRELRYLDLEAI